VVPFALWPEALFLESIGAEVSLRRRAEDERPFTTTEGNLVLDATFGPIADAASLAATLDAQAGIVAHGLFVGFATEVVVAGDRSVRHQLRDADEETEDAT
jgi:ribose 5-phosphate isomerase A